MDNQQTVPFDVRKATKAVVSVGYGRGFVVETIRGRVVITAAHCLPVLPPARPDEEEVTQPCLGALTDAAPRLLAECLFVDPVADVAVLGIPDGVSFDGADTAFEELVDRAEALPLGYLSGDAPGWLLSLDGEWKRCSLQLCGPYSTSLYVMDALGGIHGGMSGSPILLNDGSVVGVISTSSGTSKPHTEGGPQPWLMQCLPAWLLMAAREERSRIAPIPN